MLYSFPHTLGEAGIATVAGHQVRALIAAGFEVTVYATATAVGLPGAHQVVRTLVAGEHRIPHRALGGVRSAYRYHDLRVANVLATRPYAFDVVHTWPRACVRTLRTAARIDVPGLRELCSPHSRSACELAEREAAAVGLRLPRRHAHRGTAGHLAREDAEYAAARLLLAPSDQVRRSFLERGYPPAALVRHQYGYDPDRFRPAAGERPADRPFTVVFAGRGEPNKGLHYALRAWREAGAPGRFLICGEVMPVYRARIAPLFEVPGVVETGFVGDLGAVLRDADALVLASVTEGSALVALEAAASGCVPVISDASGAPTRHLVDGLVHRAGDVEELASHLRRLADDPGLLAKLRDAAIAGSADYTWERAGARLAEIYRAARRVPAPLPGESDPGESGGVGESGDPAESGADPGDLAAAGSGSAPGQRGSAPTPGRSRAALAP